MTAPFDPEAEARKLQDWWREDSEPYNRSVADIASALRAAFAAGEKAGAEKEREAYEVDGTRVCMTCDGRGSVKTYPTYDTVSRCPRCGGSGNLVLLSARGDTNGRR